MIKFDPLNDRNSFILLTSAFMTAIIVVFGVVVDAPLNKIPMLFCYWLMGVLLCVAAGFAGYGTSKRKRKFRCTFYGFHRPYIRMCTRTRKSALIFCVKQLFHCHSFFFWMKRVR